MQKGRLLAKREHNYCCVNMTSANVLAKVAGEFWVGRIKLLGHFCHESGKAKREIIPLMVYEFSEQFNMSRYARPRVSLPVWDNNLLF